MESKLDLKLYLTMEADYRQEDVEAMNSYELFDAWCNYNGFIHYSDDILEAVQAAFDIKLY